MRRARDAVRDVEVVEVVDVATDAPVLGGTGGLGIDDAAGPADAAERARRFARRRERARRVARRWWPVPVLVVGALVASQVVVDARERDRVAARQQVTGVLRTVDPALAPTRTLGDDRLGLSLTGITVGDDLRIGYATGSWGDARELVALDASGEPVWRTPLDPPGEPTGTSSLQFPSCVADPSGAALRCLVLDRDSSDALEDASGWQVDAPTRARLLTLDAADGTTSSTRDVPALSGWAGDGDLQVLASLDDGALRVTAWDTGAAEPDAATSDVMATDPLWRTDVDVSADVQHLVYPPDLTVARGRVVVHTDAGTWALDAVDGTVQTRADEYLGVSRTGHLVTGTAELLADDGSPLTTLPGQPVYFGVDDGGLPGTEFVVSLGGYEARRLTAVDVDALADGDAERWSVAVPGWSDGAVVLLEGVLYGTGAQGAWARDAATGAEIWRTDLALSTELGSNALTDGRHLLALGRTEAFSRAGITVAPAGDARTAASPDPGATTGSLQALVALDLGSGSPVWATRLPLGVRAIWGDGADLVGWGDDDAVLLN